MTNKFMLKKIKITVEVSARHIHLNQKDLDKLFGRNYKLKKLRDLSQTGEFAAKEILIGFNQNKTSSKVGMKFKTSTKVGMKFRVIGPARKESQIELSQTDAIKLNINADLRLSGDLKNIKNYLEIKGPKGKAKVKVIIAKRHLHCSKEQAKKFGLKNNQKVNVEICGDRGLIFNNIIVRLDASYNLSCHIDTDEANACGLGRICGFGYLITKN